MRQGERNDMLKTKFWRSLRSDRLKNATRIHFETTSSFELLRRQIRAEEYEMKVNSGIHYNPVHAEGKDEAKESDSKMDILLLRLSSLEKQMKEIDRNSKSKYKKENQDPQQRRKGSFKNRSSKAPLNM